MHFVVSRNSSAITAGSEVKMMNRKKVVHTCTTIVIDKMHFDTVWYGRKAKKQPPTSTTYSGNLLLLLQH